MTGSNHSSSAKELKALSGFAVDESTAFILAVQPDEWAGPKHRTFVFRVHAGAAEFVQTIQCPLQRCWLSRSMVAYCTTADGAVMSFRQGTSSSEKVSPRKEELDAIIGFSAKRPVDDELIVCGTVSIFARRAGRWIEHQLPDEVGEIYRLHGLAPDEVYICTDAGLYLWNGAELLEKEGPDDEVLDVFVRSPTELVAVGDGVHLWSDEGGWKRLKSPFRQHSVGLCLAGDSLFIPSRHGVLCLRGAVLEKVSDLPSGQLIGLGNQIVAAGREGGLAYFDGRNWRRLPLPRLRPSENP
jgi:hypothetical protein